MTRQQKYPNTKTFEFFNANPKGKLTCDCVIRAIATATGITYNKVVEDLTDMCIKTGYMVNSKECYSKYLEKLGWKKNKQPRKDDGTKYTGKEFCMCFNPTLCIANIGGNHVVCIKDSKVVDTWNSTCGCIGNYWTKQ